jgi:hypothetical protein
VTEVALQAVTGATTPFSITALLPCVAPNPDPEITTEVPTGPPVVDSAVMAGVAALGVFTDTLSNVAVARAELLELFATNPIYTFCAMLIVTLVPICDQFTPSADVNPLNVLRGTSLMTPAVALGREPGAVLLDREGRVKVQVDRDDHPIGVTLDGRQGRLVAVNGEARPEASSEVDIVVASVDLKLREAIELRRATGNPVVLVDQLGRLAGLCGDEEIYRGLLRRERPGE